MTIMVDMIADICAATTLSAKLVLGLRDRSSACRSPQWSTIFGQSRPSTPSTEKAFFQTISGLSSPHLAHSGNTWFSSPILAAIAHSG
eukprot:6149322-Amphidinium_carterae.1